MKITKLSLFALLQMFFVVEASAQSDVNPAELKQMQSRLYKVDSSKASKLIGDNCKDSGGQGTIVPMDAPKTGPSSVEVICFVPTKTRVAGDQASNSMSAGDVAGVVGDAITSNASSLGSSAASSLPLIGGFFSLIGAASSISQSNEMVEQSKKQMADMMSSINQVKYEISPVGKTSSSQLRIRMYRMNQEQVVDPLEYQKQFDAITALLGSEPSPSK